MSTTPSERQEYFEAVLDMDGGSLIERVGNEFYLVEVTRLRENHPADPLEFVEGARVDGDTEDAEGRGGDR